MSKQYVQHISGVGEKWELDGKRSDEYESGIDWCVKAKNEGLHFLPKSEYRLCDPPERWVDVTKDCRVDEYANRVGEFLSILHGNKPLTDAFNVMSKDNGYRIRKVQFPSNENVNCKIWAFIIEQKVTE